MTSGSKLALLGLAMVVMGQTAVAAEGVEHKYFGVTGFYLDADEDRLGDGSGAGLDLLLGRQLSGPWYGEVRAFMAGMRGEPGVTTTQFNGGMSLDFHYLIGERGLFSAFVLAGGGFVFNDADSVGGDDGGFQGNAGLGLVSRKLTSSNVRLRLEGRAVYEDYLDGVTDYRVGLGLEIPLAPAEIVIREVVVERQPEPGPPAEGVYPARPADADNDGVIDSFDVCPGTLPGTRVDRSGCALPEQNVILKGVQFELSSDRLTPQSMTILDQAVRALRGQPRLRVTIAGHTDNTGPEDYNMRLSLARAKAVKHYLLNQGIAANRLRTEGYGPKRPVSSNDTEQGRAINRRVEFMLDDKGEAADAVPPPSYGY